MNTVKKLLNGLTGYWLHKVHTLPIGSDLFIDIQYKLKYPSLNVVFDVGANAGQTIKYFRFNESKAKIYSFEPVRKTYEQLKKYAGTDKGCVLENMALGNESGEKIIRLFNDDMSVLNSLRDDVMNADEGAVEEKIKIDTLIGYCKTNSINKIDFLKIDTEGYEINVLEGAKEMLQEAKISFVYCETGFVKTNKCNTYFAELTEYLADLDYYFFGLYNVDSHDWIRGNHLGNALYVHKSIFPQ